MNSVNSIFILVFSIDLFLGFFALLQECEEGLQSSAPEMQFALDYGRQLADDDILSDNEQKTVKQETEKLEKELNELKGGVEEQKTRLFFS